MKVFFLSDTQYMITSGSHNRFDIYKCQSCGHGFTPLRVPKSVINSWYSNAPIDTTFILEQSARSKSAHIVLNRLIRLLPEKGRLLDVGAGPGLFVKEAQKHGFEAFGLELSAWATTWGKIELGLKTLKTGDYRTLNEYSPGEFDILTAFDVIEHIADPLDFIQKCARVVRPGGYIVLTTPQYDSLLANIMGARWYCIIPAHLHYFTRTSLANALKKEGFVIKSNLRHTRYLSAKYLWRRLLDYIGFKKMDNSAGSNNITIPVNFRDEFEIYAQNKHS